MDIVITKMLYRPILVKKAITGGDVEREFNGRVQELGEREKE